MENNKIESFTDLKAWKEAHHLVLQIYTLTHSFPSEEKFGLVNQIQRAVVSISSNIAEGFSRQSYLEKKQFFYVSLGSLTEVQNQLLIARDLLYLKEADFKNLANQTVVVSKLLNGLIKSARELSHNT